MKREEILNQLKNDVYCRLSKTKNGVGVVAIKIIPANTNPFRGCYDGGYIPISLNEIAKLDKSVRQMVYDFCVLKDGNYYLPESGLEAIDKSYYLNHSNTPNMVATKLGAEFITLKDIKEGEELTVDYNTYDDQPDEFKD